jgi:hypothetical protein
MQRGDDRKRAGLGYIGYQIVEHKKQPIEAKIDISREGKKNKVIDG